VKTLRKIEKWRTKVFLWFGLPLIAAMGLIFGIGDLVPAWQAHAGSGAHGTFTAERQDCNRRSCDFVGSWRAADGGGGRTDVRLYDEPDSLRIGGTTEAIDSGASKGVFSTAGGSTYLLVTALVLAGLAAAVGWVFFLIRFFRGRREAAAG
jgi:hypothetical protein